VTEQIFEQHLEREGQARDAGKPVGLGLGQAEIIEFLTVDLERAPAFEAVERGFKCRGQRDLLKEGVSRRPCKGVANAVRVPDLRVFELVGDIKLRAPVLYKSACGNETMTRRELGGANSFGPRAFLSPNLRKFRANA
jgi:hypothetical protein